MKKTTPNTKVESSSVATPSAETTTKKTRSRAKADVITADVAPTKKTTRSNAKTTKVTKTAKKATEPTADTKGVATKPATKRARTKKPLSKSQANSVPRQTLLEFVQREDGTMALQECNSDRVLVTINFGEIVKDMMGAESIPTIGHHMIQAAISHMMQEQMSRYHAQVYDEPVARFS